MKKETLQARIEKHLYTKGGSLAKKYEEVVELLNTRNAQCALYIGRVTVATFRCMIVRQILNKACHFLGLTMKRAMMHSKAARTAIS